MQNVPRQRRGKKSHHRQGDKGQQDSQRRLTKRFIGNKEKVFHSHHNSNRFCQAKQCDAQQPAKKQREEKFDGKLDTTGNRQAQLAIHRAELAFLRNAGAANEQWRHQPQHSKKSQTFVQTFPKVIRRVLVGVSQQHNAKMQQEQSAHADECDVMKLEFLFQQRGNWLSTSG